MASPDGLVIAIRDMTGADESFVMSSWKKSNRDASKLPGDLYYQVMQHRIARILRDKDTRLRIATDPETPELIIGWACATGPVLHYAYTRQVFRNAKVATRLLADLGLTEPLTVTHLTHTAEAIRKTHRLEHEPERLRE